MGGLVCSSVLFCMCQLWDFVTVCFYYPNSKASTLQKLFLPWNNTSVLWQPCCMESSYFEMLLNHVFPPLLSSVPIHMLLIPTLDQAHHSPRAAWDTQLPPSSLHSTPIRHIGTELCGVCQCTVVAHAAGLAAALGGNLVWAMRMYCTTTSSQRPVAKFHQWSQLGW